MRNLVFILTILLSISGCKQDVKKEEASKDTTSETTGSKLGVKQLKGEFIYYADAAVLQTSSEVYGVEIDSMMHVLQDQAKLYKKEVTDMVPVSVKAEITAKPKGEEGWPYRLRIMEVLEVYQPNPENNNVIKIEKQKE